MCSPLFEKCIIYDGGARRYEIHEHVEEVLEFWEGIKERQLRTSEHRSMYSYVRLSIDRCTATYV